MPDLTNFRLKPYVPHTTPKVEEERKVERLVTLDESLLNHINQQVEDASRGRL